MQAVFVSQLRQEEAAARIVCEEDFVDVTLECQNRRVLFEIKTALVPRDVIRQALSQLLEYRYRRELAGKALQLVIVGRAAPDPMGEAFLARLRDEFRLPLTYRALPLDDESA